MSDMFALSHGELAIVLFIFALVWGAALLPRVAEHVAVSLAAKRARRSIQGR